MEVAYAPVDGGRLAYQVTGDGRPVVLMHAGLVHMGMWDGQFDLLAAGYRVIRYDARGHGRSTAAEKSYRDTDDLRDLLRHLGIERATLIGGSLGARVAVDTALRHPDLVEAMLLAGPGISGMERMDITEPALVEADEAMSRAAEARDVPAFIEGFLRGWVDGPYRAADEVDPVVRERCREMAAETLSAYADGSFGGEGTALEEGAIDRLAEIRVPTYTVLGDRDTAVIEAVVETIRDRIPGASGTVIAAAGHMVNMERPDAFNECLMRFLAA
jgi:3-oxoadipate enol-lactonase